MGTSIKEEIEIKEEDIEMLSKLLVFIFYLET